MRGCESGCGGNSNDHTCSVKDRELNEWLSNCQLLRKDFSLWHLFLFLVMILTVKMEEIFRTATVLSVLMIVYTIPCHDRSH
jgi:hypothetical protein